ncbi:MAG: hypothetical protein PGN29_04485 [Gordonia paraffinivorans]
MRSHRRSSSPVRGDRAAAIVRRLVETLTVAGILALAFYFGPGQDLFH